jgi:hypothetical protein
MPRVAWGSRVLEVRYTLTPGRFGVQPCRFCVDRYSIIVLERQHQDEIVLLALLQIELKCEQSTRPSIAVRRRVTAAGPTDADVLHTTVPGAVVSTRKLTERLLAKTASRIERHCQLSQAAARNHSSEDDDTVTSTRQRESLA